MLEPVALTVPLQQRINAGTCQNLLLSGLTTNERRIVWQHLEPVALQSKRVIHFANMPMEHVYFLDSGLVSVIAATCQRKAAEVWLIGNEGLVGIPVALGERVSPHRRVVQLSGRALRIRSDSLLSLMREIPRLNELLLYYSHAVLVQAAQLGACNANHDVPRRLARWMLMAQDRSATDELPLTHEMLSRMLGVRRATVTDCIASLEHSDIATSGRSMIKILDRNKLKHAACACYSVIRGADRRLREKCMGTDREVASLADNRTRRS